MILETTFLVDLLRGNQKAAEKLKYLQDLRTPLYIATPSIFELWSGLIHAKKSEQEKRKIVEVLDSQFILDLTKEASIKAGKIDGQLVLEGKKIEPEDSMIAGIAITNHEKVLTRNTEHFMRVPGLIVERY